jgi:hypothetical protein
VDREEKEGRVAQVGKVVPVAVVALRGFLGEEEQDQRPEWRAKRVQSARLDCQAHLLLLPPAMERAGAQARTEERGGSSIDSRIRPMSLAVGEQVRAELEEAVQVSGYAASVRPGQNSRPGLSTVA